MQKSPLTFMAFLLALTLVGLIESCGGFDWESESGIGASTNSSELNKLQLRYNFSMEMSGPGPHQNPRLRVELSFIMPSSRVYLQLPNSFLRKQRLYERLEGLQVVGENAYLSQHEAPEFKVLDGEANEKVTLRYFLRSSSPDKPNSTDSFSAPIIHQDFFMFVGQMALIMPHGVTANQNEFHIELNWDMPKNFEVFNSFGERKRRQTITTSGADLWDSIFFGGSNIRSYQTDVNGKPVIITLEGQWSRISDAEFVTTVQRLLKTERDTWRDNNFPYFIVNIIAMGDACNGQRGHKFAGTAHKNSFRAYFPRDCELSASMKQLISHELMHNWIGKKIKMGTQRGHIDGKWLTEGWTDFYGRILAYRAGVINQREYFETLNRALQSYQLSKERHSPLTRLVEHMYRKPMTNPDLEQLPYQQGELMALLLNKKIKENSNFRYSLDDVIRDMLAEAERNGGSKNFKPDEVKAIIDRYAPGAFEEEYRKIEEGTVPFVPPKLAACSEPELTDRLIMNNNVHPMPGSFKAYLTFNQCERWLK